MDGIQLSGAGAQTGVSSTAKETQSGQFHPAGKDTAKDETPSIHEMLQEAREKAQKRRDSLKLRTNSSQYGDVAMTAYSKLARAKSQGDVTAAAGYARRQIARCRAALGSDSDNATRIKAAIRQLQKAVSRAGKKSRELRREDLIKARARKAQQEKQRRKADGFNYELNRRKTLRMIREGGYLRETEIENRLQDQIAKTELELRNQAQSLGAAVAPSLEEAAAGYAAAAEIPAPVSEVDIQV